MGQLKYNQPDVINALPEQPDRFVCKDFRKVHTDDIEALAWVFFNRPEDEASNRLKHAVKTNSRYIIYELEILWADKEYKWIKNELFHSEDDINGVLKDCYVIQCGEDILNVILHYASVGESHPKYIMINNWIYKLYPNKLYGFLVGKRLRTNEDVDEIITVIEGQYQKNSYKDIREGINECKGINQDLYDHYTDLAQYFRGALQGVYTQEVFPLNKEAWFTTYFFVTVICESIRNFRSLVIMLMASDLSLHQTPEKRKEILLVKLPMAKGGTWIDTKKRGFHGASIPVRNKKSKLKKLIEEEDEICKTWLLVHGKTDIDTDMIKRLLLLLYGEPRLSKNTSILETFITNHAQFKKKINCSSSPIVSTRPSPILTIEDKRVLKPTSISPSVMFNSTLEYFQKEVVYLNFQDLDWCRAKGLLSIWSQFPHRFITDPLALRSFLHKRKYLLHFTKLFKADTLIPSHLNQDFSKFTPLKFLCVYGHTVTQKKLIFSPPPPELLLSSLVKRPCSAKHSRSTARHKITRVTSLNQSGCFSPHIVSECWQKSNMTFVHTCWEKKFPLHNSFSFTEFIRIHQLSDCQLPNYSSTYRKRLNYSPYGNNISRD